MKQYTILSDKYIMTTYNDIDLPKWTITTKNKSGKINIFSKDELLAESIHIDGEIKEAAIYNNYYTRPPYRYDSAIKLYLSEHTESLHLCAFKCACIIKNIQKLNVRSLHICDLAAPTIHIAAFTQLKSLTIHYSPDINLLYKLPQFPISLEELSIQGTLACTDCFPYNEGIDSKYIDLFDLVNLVQLDIYFRIDEYSQYQMQILLPEQIKYVKLANFTGVQNLRDCTKLKSFHFNNNFCHIMHDKQYIYCEDISAQNIQDLVLINYTIFDVPKLGEYDKLKKLVMNYTTLHDIDTAHLPRNLVYLSVCGTHISHINIKHPNITELSLYDASPLTIMHLPNNLKILNIEREHLASMSAESINYIPWRVKWDFPANHKLVSAQHRHFALQFLHNYIWRKDCEFGGQLPKKIVNIIYYEYCWTKY